MAEEEVRKKFPYLFGENVEDWPHNFGGSFIPLKLKGWPEALYNALFPFQFNKAIIYAQAFKPQGQGDLPCNVVEGVPESYLYRGAQYDLKFNDDIPREAKHKLMKCIGDFFLGDHPKHLLALKKNFHADADIATILAHHLFVPLTLEGSYKLDNRHYPQGIKKCPACNGDVNAGNTSFGNQNVWHGWGDILVGQSVVKVQTQQNNNKEDDSSEFTQDYSYVPGSWEPCVKRTKVESTGSEPPDIGFCEDEENEYTSAIDDDNYMPLGPQSICHSTTLYNETLSQILSQTITNAFLQVKTNPKVKNHFIPAFLASDKYITIHMYNPVDDILLTQSRAMPIFEDNQINPLTVLSVWLALNMLRFSVYPPDDKSVLKSTFHSIKQSDFHTIVGNRLDIYKNDLTSPVDMDTHCSKSDCNDVWYHDKIQHTRELMQLYKDRKISADE